MTTVEISEDLKDIVSTTIESIKQGLKEEKCGVSGTIKFEVSVAKSKNAKSGFQVFIADASGNYTKDNTSKISFEIAGILSESEKTDLKNQISQLQGMLGLNNSEVTKLTKQIQTLDNTVKEQALKLKQKEIQIEELQNQRKQSDESALIAEKQIDQMRRQIQELNDWNRKLQDDLKKNPTTFIK